MTDGYLAKIRTNFTAPCDFGREFNVTTCINCAANFYKPVIGDSSCLPCPDGLNTAGATGQRWCRNGTATIQLTHGPSRNRTAFDCKTGSTVSTWDSMRSKGASLPQLVGNGITQTWYVTLNRAQLQFFDMAALATLRMRSNSGFTSLALVRYTGTAISSERVSQHIEGVSD
jgi:hypothetical protein